MWYLTKSDKQKIFQNLLGTKQQNEREDKILEKKIAKLQKDHELNLRKLNNFHRIEMKQLDKIRKK